eukprot:TRINITY_DN15285_c0_g5_i1.p1 TRINITY_DN15285_c0_g5~~TRINITY_DN15285_c0_g5_i1.p1  ORF type:complete len:451 (+),score=42.80 TRINITY_DN15285_c0_g5_i1:163-1515(+)
MKPLPILNPGRTIGLVNDLYQLIRSRYEDTATIDNTLSKGKLNFDKEMMKSQQKLIREIEHRELLRKESEKVILLQLTHVQIRRTDKLFSQLNKILIKVLPLISFPTLSLERERVSTEVHLWDSLNTGHVGRHQEDKVNGGWLTNMQLGKRGCLAIDFVRNGIKSEGTVEVYYLMYYSVCESRRHLEGHIVLLNSMHESLSVETVLEVLQKSNKFIERNIKSYYVAVQNKKLFLNKGERIIKMLEEEMKGHESIVVSEKYTLKELLKKFEGKKGLAKLKNENKVKEDIRDYINNLKSEYEKIEEVKQTRRCLYLKSILAIQKAYRKYCESKRNKAAIIIQKSYRKYHARQKKKMIIRQFIAQYKIMRWFKLMRKKRILRRNVMNEDLCNYYNSPKVLGKVTKVQAVVRKFLVIRNVLPYVKLMEETRSKKIYKNECKLSLIHICSCRRAI